MEPKCVPEKPMRVRAKLVQVIICGRRAEQIDATANELNAAAADAGSGGEVIAIKADVGTSRASSPFTSSVPRRWIK